MDKTLIPSLWLDYASQTPHKANRWQTKLIGTIQFGIARWEVDIQLAGIKGAYHGPQFDSMHDACHAIQDLIEDIADALEDAGNAG